MHVLTTDDFVSFQDKHLMVTINEKTVANMFFSSDLELSTCYQPDKCLTVAVYDALSCEVYH